MYTNDCQVTIGSEVLAVCEAESVLQSITLFLTAGTMSSQLLEWSQKSILKAAPFRSYFGQRKPWSTLSGPDRAQRLSEVIDILIEMGVFMPMSVKETIMEIGEVSRNKGSFVRVVNIHRLKQAAGIEVPEVPSSGIQEIVRVAPLAYDELIRDQLARFQPATAAE